MKVIYHYLRARKPVLVKWWTSISFLLSYTTTHTVELCADVYNRLSLCLLGVFRLVLDMVSCMFYFLIV